LTSTSELAPEYWQIPSTPYYSTTTYYLLVPSTVY